MNLERRKYNLTLSPPGISTLYHAKAAGALPSALISISLQGIVLEGGEREVVLYVGMVEMQPCEQLLIGKQCMYLSFAVDLNYKIAKATVCTLLGLHPPPGTSRKRAVKHLLDSGTGPDSKMLELVLRIWPSLCPFRDGTRSESQSQGSATKQSIQRSPSASDTMAALAKCVHSLNPTCSSCVAGSERALHS